MAYLLFTTGLNARFIVMRKCAPGPPGQQLERSAVRVGELAGDVEAKARSARPRREERLEDLAAKLAGDAGPVIGELADDRIAHVSGARGDPDAAFLLLAVLPRVAHQVPDDLVQVAAVEHDPDFVRESGS